jgi:hypothetical protein
MKRMYAWLAASALVGPMAATPAHAVFIDLSPEERTVTLGGSFAVDVGRFRPAQRDAGRRSRFSLRPGRVL